MNLFMRVLGFRPKGEPSVRELISQAVREADEERERYERLRSSYLAQRQRVIDKLEVCLDLYSKGEPDETDC
jgi:hypothetical protein